jgi:hypothetical protein
MGITFSLLLIALGAILAFALNVHWDVVSLYTVGWILMAVGAVGLVVALVAPQLWFRRERIVRETPYDRRYVS